MAISLYKTATFNVFITLASLLLICSTASAKVTYPSGVVVDYAHSSNYTANRSYNNSYQLGTKNLIDSIAIHTTEGSYQSAINWFNNPEADCSAHYVIAKDGRVTQMVNSWHTAWTTNYINRRSIGFEMAGQWANEYQWNYAPGEAGYGTTYKNYRPNLDKLANICAFFCARDTIVRDGVTYTYDIPIEHPTGSAVAYYDWSTNPATYVMVKKYDVKGFVGHNQITPKRKNDPGPYFPWEDFMLMVQSYVDHDENHYYDLSTIPEPATATMIGLAALALVSRRKR